MKFDPLMILAGDRHLISYRPILNHITGCVTSTILLQQIIFRWQNAGKKPFYKFKEPCDHKLYQEGDSWCEELGFSRKQFDTALSNIGHKLRKGEPRKRDCLVYYWTDISRVTYYDINETNLKKKLLVIYGEKDG